MVFESKTLRSTLYGIALALLAPLSTAYAATPPAAFSPVASAQAFVQTMAQGHFTQAEATFTDQMKQDATPDKLKNLWTGFTQRFGPFQKTTGHKVKTWNGYTLVVLGAEFKSRTVGLQLAFDSMHRIAGLYVVSAP